MSKVTAPVSAPNQFQELTREVRLMSSLSALYGHAVADRLGLAHADLESLDFLNLFGPMTAGRLSELTGLSSGATTRLIDRLERAGYARRKQDPGDRRRVIIELVAGKGEEVMHHFLPMAQRIYQLWGTYSDEQIAVLLDYMRRSNAIMAEENARIRREAGKTDDSEGVAASRAN